MLEYISMLRVIDTTLLINRTAAIRYMALRGNSKMEYLLEHYFPYHGFPDIWIYKPPFRHEILASKFTQITSDYGYMFSLFNMYLPGDVDVLFVGDTRECLPHNSSQRFRKTWNMYPNEKIHMFNQILFHLLRKNGR